MLITQLLTMNELLAGYVEKNRYLIQICKGIPATDLFLAGPISAYSPAPCLWSPRKKIIFHSLSFPSSTWTPTIDNATTTK